MVNTCKALLLWNHNHNVWQPYLAPLSGMWYTDKAFDLYNLRALNLVGQRLKCSLLSYLDHKQYSLVLHYEHETYFNWHPKKVNSWQASL